MSERIPAGQRVLARDVYKYLAKNYPEDVLGWVENQRWVARKVPLADIDMDRRPGGRDMDKVRAIAKDVQAGKHMEPVVLVESSDGYQIADGYHRTLAFRHAGKSDIDAWVALGEHGDGPWSRAMHDAKKNLSAPVFPGAFGVQSMEGHAPEWMEVLNEQWRDILSRLSHEEVVTTPTMSVEQRLDRVEQFMAIFVAEKMSDTPNPSGERKKGYPKDKSEYADPQDDAYPLNDKEHVDAASRFFGKYKDRYSEAKRKEIKRRIDEAKKKFGISGDSTASAASTSAADYQIALGEVLSIVEDAFVADEEPQALLAIIQDMLSSEDNPRTRAQMYDADAMIDDFMRETRGIGSLGHK